MALIPENLGKGLSLVSEIDPTYPHQKKMVIGIAGTAKNTGKTTTLNCLLKEASYRNISIAVTSIGFDGEDIDNVTFLPKPRITVYPNFIITTSQQCLQSSTAVVDVLQHTGMYTPLGEIVILRVMKEGRIVIAGPSNTKELRVVVEKMKSYNPHYVFIDGSLNRIAPMTVVDSIIFTTGGARSTDISTLCSEMQVIESFFHLPVTDINVHTASNVVAIPLLLEKQEVEAFQLQQKENKTTLYISKLISSSALEHLTEYCVKGSIMFQNIIFPDPFSMLIQENIFQTYECISHLKKSNVSVLLLHVPTLSCIIANPFYPQYNSNIYYERYLHSVELLERLQLSCSAPVFNAKETKSSIIFDTCLQ